MKEIIFEELGYLSQIDCEKIKKVMEGRTYMNFEVTYSNFAGNCTLVCRTNYDARESEIRRFFIACLVRNMADRIE